MKSPRLEIARIRSLLVVLVAVTLFAGAAGAAAEQKHRDRGGDRVGVAGTDCGARRTPNTNEVMLFEISNYGGACTAFTASDPNLQDDSIGGNRASSIKVGSAVQVRLFSATNYRGTFSGVYLGNDANFSGDPIGHDHADSIRISPRCSLSTAPAAHQVKLYFASNFGGFCEAFTASDADLADNVIGTGTSSIKVGSGVLARLYAGTGFTGRSQLFAGSDASLGDSGDIGHDTARSLRVSAR